MPTVDVAATRQAASDLTEAAENIHHARPAVAVASISDQVPDAVSRSVLGGLQAALQLRLQDLSGEIDTMSTAMSTLADNVEKAMDG
ncbi:hypothetical protein [Ornithinimicrobium pratense]|uniref:Uncharacterized protein n=1 Tax=Ornithinimicrobium pratense TaxID=2593973 RepID=A0A5J6V4L7_9MICO|nr:hypothetical protein [Ornithinimicrobium pratense]QFG68071.1 hypothetical protein FY030_04465 [Ornithinimicrobium pratense]